MLRLKPFLLGAVTIIAAIAMLAVLHHWRAVGRDGTFGGARQELAVGFLPVT